jgi:hypothetical protein
MPYISALYAQKNSIIRVLYIAIFSNTQVKSVLIAMYAGRDLIEKIY